MKEITAGAVNDPLDGKDSVSIVYLGGSITQGCGASSHEKSWVGLTSRFLDDFFKGKRLEHHNSGIGGTDSAFGLLRAERDVIAYRPDLLFIEFAVNDSGAKNDFFSPESILLTVNAAGLSPRIVFVLTAYRDEDKKIAREKYLALGQRYGIPVVDLQSVIDEKRKTEDISPYFRDVCHPSDAGHSLYAQTITDALPRLLSKPLPDYGKPAFDPASRPLFCAFHPFSEPAQGVTIRGDHTPRDGALVFDKAGDGITVKFSGTVFGLVDFWDNGGGKYRLSVDGEERVIDTFYSPEVYQVNCRFTRFDLEPGEHTVSVTLLGEKNPKSKGTEVLLSAFVTEK